MFTRFVSTPALSRRLLQSAYLYVGVLLMSMQVPLPAATPSFTSNATVHDPAIVREGSTYYVFGSHLASASTTDLMNWKQISTSVAAGNALVPDPLTEFSEALTWAQATTLWAPDVKQLADGRFYYYYCACKGDSPLSAMGLAVADKITGPYKNVGLLLKSGMWGKVSPDGKIYDNAIHPNVVDPMVFFDKTGLYWMVYGSYSGGIFIMRLDPVTGLLLPNQGYGKKLIGGNNSTIEGPCIYYSPDTDYYYLLMTYGGLDSTGGYNVRMGRSRSPDGPYLDPSGKDLTTVAGAFGTLFDNPSIAPYGAKLLGNYQFLHVTGEPGSVSRGYLSPGGVSTYRNPKTGVQLLTFHTRFVGRGEAHEVRVHQFYTTEDGWLVVAPQRYAKEALGRADAAVIPGAYKLINHGKAIAKDVNTSVAVALASDGVVSGSVTGTWQLSGDHFATLVLDGKTYRGVFCQLWDDDNQEWVESFTALSGEGVAVWGCKVAATTGNTTPAFVTQPASQSVTAGQTATFSVSATGSPAPVYQWLKDGVLIPGATASTYAFKTNSVSNAGAFSVIISNAVTSFQSDAAELSVAPAPGPSITMQPASVSIAAGTPASLSVLGAGTAVTYQWRRYDDAGVPQLVAGASAPTLAFQAISSREEGVYDCVVSDSNGSSYTSTATLTVKPTLLSNPAARLSNLSSRTMVKSGDNAQIAGFVLSGAGTKTLLVRASGPALLDFGLSTAAPDPTMALFNQADTQTVLFSNDDWVGPDVNPVLADLFKQLGAFEWKTGSKDAALQVSLPEGRYSSMIQSKGKDGIGLVELYDTGAEGPRLVNISTRSLVGTGSNGQVAGFVVAGSGLKTLLIRASGPALAAYMSGTVQDPVLKLYDQEDTSTSFVQNDDWYADAAKGALIEAAADKAGAFAWKQGSADAAVLVSLRPGRYSAVCTAKSGEGVGLIEVYEINP